MLARRASVPEATVHEYRRFVFRKDNIRVSRQITPVQSETISHAMQQLSNANFRRRIIAMYSGHDVASFFRTKHIGHVDAHISHGSDELAGFKFYPQAWIGFLLNNNGIILFDDVCKLSITNRVVKHAMLVYVCGQKLLNVPDLYAPG